MHQLRFVLTFHCFNVRERKLKEKINFQAPLKSTNLALTVQELSNISCNLVNFKESLYN